MLIDRRELLTRQLTRVLDLERRWLLGQRQQEMTAPECCGLTVVTGFRIVGMGATLRVDPARLRTAAANQAEVGEFVAGMGTGQSLASAGGGVAGLLSGDACHYAGALLDGATTTVHDELTDHSTNLSAAADHYDRTDLDLGNRLKRIADEP